MSVDIGDAFGRGIDSTTSRNGGMFAVMLFVLGVVNQLFASQLAPAPGNQMGGPMGMTPGGGVDLGIPGPVAGIGTLVVQVITLVVAIAVLRTFVAGATEQLPDGAFSNNIVAATLNAFVGSIVFGLVVVIGFVLLFVPGVFLLVSLWFWVVYVAVEDRNFVDGFRSSWGLTKGNRLTLFGLGLTVLVVGLVLSVVFQIPAGIVGGIPGIVVGQIGSAIAGVFGLATTAAAYDQLTAAEEAEAGATDPV